MRCPGISTKSLDAIVPTVKCSLDHKFCFGCGLDVDHQPAICPIVKLWLKKCADDSETANWIQANTKECPKCQATIEKNGGCNHMTCKKCKYEVGLRACPLWLAGYCASCAAGNPADMLYRDVMLATAVLLDLHGRVVGARNELVQLQPVRREEGGQQGREEQVSRIARALPACGLRIMSPEI